MKTILVPTDFSSAARNATDYAVELAKFFNAKLILVNAYPVPSQNLDMFPIGLVNSVQNTASKNIEDLKEELLLNKGQGLTIECWTEMGSAYDVIDTTAKKYFIDLIVMGIVGEAGGVKKHLIGSTAVKVARYIEIPAFIIPEKVTYHPVRSISFACDMKGTEKTTLISTIKYFGEIFKAEIEIVNIEEPEEEMSYEKSRTSVFIEQKLEKTPHKIVYVTETNIAKGLEDYYETHQADVVIVNPKRHTIFYHLFKENVTNELVFNTHSPILAIH